MPLTSQPNTREMSLVSQPNIVEISLAIQPNNRKIPLLSQPNTKRISLIMIHYSIFTFPWLCGYYSGINYFLSLTNVIYRELWYWIYTYWSVSQTLWKYHWLVSQTPEKCHWSVSQTTEKCHWPISQTPEKCHWPVSQTPEKWHCSASQTPEEYPWSWYIIAYLLFFCFVVTIVESIMFSLSLMLYIEYSDAEYTLTKYSVALYTSKPFCQLNDIFMSC